MTLPLKGIRVLDLSHLLPGPLCTLMLADLGAEVIKIERPPYGDLNRRIPPFHHELSAYFMMLNRNKKSRSLDLKLEKEKNKFLNLVRTSDILIENFRPGVMTRLGLGYETLKKINPKLIYCAISGYGHKSPLKDFAGHDLNYIALSGVMYGMTGKKGCPPMLPTQLADIVGGSLLPAISILSALEYRRKNKKGLFLDCAMTAGTTVLLMMVLGKYFITGEEIIQGQDRMTGKYPNYSLYETKDHRTMALAAIEPKFWNEFCRVIKKPHYVQWSPLTDEPGFPTKSLERCSSIELQKKKKMIQKIFQSKTQKQWIELFKNEPNCCCTPVLNFKEAIYFLKWMGRKEFTTLKDKEGRVLPQMLFPFGNDKLSRKKHTPPPKLDI